MPRLRSRLSYHYGDSLFDDSCLLAGDGSQRVAQELLMVEGDIGYDRQQGMYDVCAVQTATQPYFYDGNIYMGISKILKRHGSSKFEEGGMKGSEKISLFFYKPHHIVFRDSFAVDTDTLAEIYKMRRSEQPDLIARLLQNGGDGVGTRSFTVRPGNMYGGETAMWMSEMFV